MAQSQKARELEGVYRELNTDGPTLRGRSLLDEDTQGATRHFDGGDGWGDYPDSSSEPAPHGGDAAPHDSYTSTWSQLEDFFDDFKKPAEHSLGFHSDKPHGGHSDKPYGGHAQAKHCQIVAKHIDWESKRDCPTAVFAVSPEYSGFFATVTLLVKTCYDSCTYRKRERILLDSCGIFGVLIPKHTEIICIELHIHCPLPSDGTGPSDSGLARSKRDEKTSLATSDLLHSNAASGSGAGAPSWKIIKLKEIFSSPFVSKLKDCRIDGFIVTACDCVVPQSNPERTTQFCAPKGSIQFELCNTDPESTSIRLVYSVSAAISERLLKCGCDGLSIRWTSANGVQKVNTNTAYPDGLFFEVDYVGSVAEDKVTVEFIDKRGCILCRSFCKVDLSYANA